LYFFFQAEDGIRDRNVTGVQTCALPILWNGKQCLRHPSFDLLLQHTDGCLQDCFGTAGAEAVPKRPESVSRCADLRSDGRCAGRSEERRVGKEGRWRWG